MDAMGDIGEVSTDRLVEHIKQTMLTLIDRILKDGQLDGRIQGLMEAAARILPSDPKTAQELYTIAFQLKEIG
jgi:hypothetical protein